MSRLSRDAQGGLAITILLDSLRAALGHPALLLEAVRVPSSPPVDLTAMLADVARRLARLDAAYDAGAFPPDEYASKRRALLAEREGLTRTAPAPPPPPVDLTAARETLRDALALPCLADTVRLLDLRVVLHTDGVLDVMVGV